MVAGVGVGGARAYIGIVILVGIGDAVPTVGTEMRIIRRTRSAFETIGVGKRVEI